MKNKHFYKISSIYTILFLVLLLLSCNSDNNNDAERFKLGIFEIPAGKGYSKTTVKRIDSLQIEEYIKYTEISTD